MMVQNEVENAAIVKRGFEAFKARDFATIVELFHDDAEWIGERTGVMAGTYSGRAAILASFAQLLEESEGTYHSTPRAVAAAGDEVFVNAKVAGERKGRKLDGDEVLIFTLRDGRVRRARLFQSDHEAAQAFWA